MKRAAITFAIGFTYGTVLLGTAGLLTGVGHGSEFFLSVVMAPFSTSSNLALLCILFWPLLALIIEVPRNRIGLGAAVAMLLCHYLGVVASVAQMASSGEWYYVSRVLETQTLMALFVIVFYVLGQGALWASLVRSWRKFSSNKGLGLAQGGACNSGHSL